MIEYLKTWAALKTDRRGVTALEYGLIAAAIIAVVAGTFVTLGQDISTALDSVKTAFTNAAA